jgi:hypothetical protein
MSDDVIVLLREDHKELRRDLREFTRTRQVDTARHEGLRDRVVRASGPITSKQTTASCTPRFALASPTCSMKR